MLAAFTTIVAGSPSPADVRSNVLAQPNPMHLFAYVTASGHITTIHRFSRMSTRLGQPTTQWDGRNFATDMDWTDMGVRTVELPPNLFNRATPTLVPVEVEEVLQYFDNNPQSDYMPVLLAGQVHPGTETAFVRMSTFVPHFLASLFLAERRSPKAMLQLVVPVLAQQNLLLQCKPLVDWLKAAVVHDGTSYVLSVNPDTALLAVDNALMDHRMMFHKSDLPDRWAPPPPTQAIATGSDVLIAQELGAMRRAHEEALADKKKTPKKRWGVEQVTKLLRLARVLSESDLPPIYTALAAGKGVAQDRIILQNAFVARCLEAGAATTTAPIVTPAFARDIGALVFAGVSIESYGQGASIFSAAGGGAGKLAEEQLNAARAWDLGASASTMSVVDLQAAADRLKIVLPTSLLSFILVLKAHSIGMDVLLGVHHYKAVAFRVYVTRVSHMESVLLEEQMLEPRLPIYLMREIQVVDTLWVLKQQNSDATIPSPEYEKPLDDMEVAKYRPIRLPAELEEVTHGPNRNSPAVTPNSRPSLPTSITGPLRQGAIANQGPSPSIAVSRSIENPTPTTGMILAPDRNNQIRAIRSAGFDANLQLPIDRSRVQFCMSYHLRGHCNDNCTRKAWHRALTTAEIAQLNKFLGPYVATTTTSGPTTPSNM